jgi:hypothetical protein
MTDAHGQRSPDAGNFMFQSESSIRIHNGDIADVHATKKPPLISILFQFLHLEQ